MKRLFQIGLVVCLLAFAPAPLPKAERRDADSIDLALFQGEWEGSGGVSIKAWAKADRIGIVVSGKRMKVYQNDKLIGDWSFSLDARHAPKRIVLTPASGKGEKLDTEYVVNDLGLMLTYPYVERFQGIKDGRRRIPAGDDNREPRPAMILLERKK